MSDRPRDLASELADRLEAAGALIESLEEEVADLRRDLAQANAALRAARDEVSARERRISELEARLRDAREENERQAAELEQATDRFTSVVDPARRLNAGIDLFNRSEHARAVAAISKSLGLPLAHAGLDDGFPSKPVLTFVWEEMAWRRYVCDPDGEGNVYLVETGDDPAEIDPIFRSNAHVDTGGRIGLGVRSR